MTELEPRKMFDEDCKSVHTLNTWTEEKKEVVRKYLEEGYWVHLGCSGLGHTLNEFVEYQGKKWVCDEYGTDNVQIARRDGWGYWYIRLR